MAPGDYPNDRFVESAWHFNTLAVRNPRGLTDYLAEDGFTEARPVIGAKEHHFHKERGIHCFVFGSGVMLIHADSWEEMRPFISALIFSEHAALAGDRWTHGG